MCAKRHKNQVFYDKPRQFLLCVNFFLNLNGQYFQIDQGEGVHRFFILKLPNTDNFSIIYIKMTEIKNLNYIISIFQFFLLLLLLLLTKLANSF